MEIFRNLNILIGRDPASSMLLLVINHQDLGKRTVRVNGQTVPHSVSRCVPEEGKAHARLTVDGEGNMILANLKSTNCTFVNGNPIMSKRVKTDSRIELGNEQYPLAMNVLMSTVSKAYAQKQGPVPPTPEPKQPQQVKEFDATPLKTAWDRYEQRKKEIASHRQRTMAYRSLSSVFTIGGGLMAGLVGIPAVGLTCSGIGVFGLIYSFFGTKNDKTSTLLEQAKEEFEYSYVCPNPECLAMLTMPYKVLMHNYGACPYCKAKLIDRSFTKHKGTPAPPHR